MAEHTDATIKVENGQVSLGSLDINTGRWRVLAHSKTTTRKQLRGEAIKCIEVMLNDWKPGDEFVLVLEPRGYLRGNPKVRRMKFITGDIETSIDEP